MPKKKKKKWERESKDTLPKALSNTEEVRIPEPPTEAEIANDAPKLKRERRAKLELELAKLRCRHCNSLGNWKVTKTTKTLRYLKCGVCSRASAVFSNEPISRTLRPSDLQKMERKASHK